MTFRLATVAALALAGLSALPSSAQNMKPGLWELNSKMHSANGELGQAMAAIQQQIANMAPGDRKRIEEMMADRGVNLSSAADGGVLVKMCMTKEMVAQNQVPIQQHGNCTARRSPVVGNTMKLSFNCTSPQSSGEGQVTFAGDSAYSMKMNIASSASGNPETMSVDATGRWLGADCGTIKPIAIPNAK
jgi:hypothetical protein